MANGSTTDFTPNATRRLKSGSRNTLLMHLRRTCLNVERARRRYETKATRHIGRRGGGIMNTKTCNICARKIGEGHQDKHISNRDIEGSLDITNGLESKYPFSFKITTGNFRFNCTNFDLCEECLWESIVRSINSENKRKEEA